MTQEKQIQKNPIEYKGFPLFNEIEDRQLRRRNQAVIMTNILEDNFVKGKIAPKGSLLIIGYMSAIPEDQRKSLMAEFIEQANARGFKIE